jgi:cytochrome c2
MGEVHGSRMVLTIPHAADRQIVIAYLETLK